MSANDGGPAFPQHGWTSNPEVLERMKNQGGMTLRDWFAGQAISSIIRDDETVVKIKNQMGVTFAEAAALMAFVVADAMLQARGVNVEKNSTAKKDGLK